MLFYGVCQLIQAETHLTELDSVSFCHPLNISNMCLFFKWGKRSIFPLTLQPISHEKGEIGAV